jgi:hypothetical protein
MELYQHIHTTTREKILLILLMELERSPLHAKVQHDRHLEVAQLSVKGRRWVCMCSESSIGNMARHPPNERPLNLG